MNTVFSVFKGSGGGGGNGNVDAKTSTTKALANSKSMLATTALKENSSYENLRHIRELESSINAFVVNADDGDDDDDTNSSSSGSQHTTIRMVGGGKRQTPLAVMGNGVDCGTKNGDFTSAAVSVITAASNGTDVVDFVVRSPVKSIPMECDLITSDVSVSKISENGGIEMLDAPSDSVQLSELASVPSACFSSDGDISSRYMTSTADDSEQCAQFPDEKASQSSQTSPRISVQHNHVVASSSGDLTHAPIIATNSRGHSESNLSASKTTNRFQKRLSLSGFPNNSMPSVHGRPATAGGALCGGGGAGGGTTGTGGEVKRTRLSTHQRNLSLDFR